MNITKAQALRIVDILFEDTSLQGNIDGYKASRFDSPIDKAAPVIQRESDAPKPLTTVRAELNDLIRTNDLTTIYWPSHFRKLLGIVEQIVMKLENVPTFKSIPGMAPFPVMPTYPAIVTPAPAWPSTFPFNQPGYTGDPLPGHGTTICGGTDTRSQQAMCQADGHVNVSTVEDDSIPF